MHPDAIEDWGRALILLIAISVLFLALRVVGRAFVAWDFELSVIHAPAAICLVFYIVKTRISIPSKRAASSLTEAAR